MVEAQTLQGLEVGQDMRVKGGSHCVTVGPSRRGICWSNHDTKIHDTPRMRTLKIYRQPMMRTLKIVTEERQERITQLRGDKERQWDGRDQDLTRNHDSTPSRVESLEKGQKTPKSVVV